MRIRRIGRRAGALAAAIGMGAIFLVAAPVELEGQKPNESIIKGVLKVTDTGEPIEGARVTLSMRRLDGASSPSDARFSTTTDKAGEFEFPGLVPGRYVVRAAAIGYMAVVSTVDLKNRQTVDLEFNTELEGVQLPELTVEERAEHGPVDWLRRRAEGRGRYVTREDIEKRNPATLPDMMRMVPGVRVECRSGSRCAIRMTRAPRGCNPAFYMDGVPSDPAIAYLTPVNDVEGVEVYSGPADTPPELEGARSRCGVIVIWTRPPPPRRARKEPKPVMIPDTLGYWRG